MGPEVIKGEKHDQSLDWWSLGVIVYELLTSIPPFNDSSEEKIFDNIVNLRITWPPIGKLITTPIIKLIVGYEDDCMSPEA